MATRRKTGRTSADTAPADAAPPRKTVAAKSPAPKAARKRAAPAVPPAPPTPEADAPAAGPAGLWRASLKALDSVRQDVTRRHTNVIETLLGIAPARTDAEGKAAARGFPGLESLGLRKFEDVFDQRVAAALERLGMPTRDELQALRTQLDQVLAQLERLEGGAPAARKAPGTRSGGSRKR